jgi:hypothetical protein
MLHKLNVIYSKIFGKNKWCFVVEKIKQNVLAKISYNSYNWLRKYKS